MLIYPLNSKIPDLNDELFANKPWLFGVHLEYNANYPTKDLF